MAHLPPTTWQDIATKDDFRVLGTELRGEISQVMKRQIRWMVMFNTALVALALTAARLLV